MTQEIADYGDDAQPIAVDEIFAQLDALAREAAKAEAEAARLADEAKAHLVNFKRIVESEIPDLMARMRLKKVTTSSGYEVEVKRVIRASIPSRDEKPELHFAGIKWLIDNGQSGLVKNLVSLKLDRGADERAKSIAAELRAQGLEPEVKSWVEPQTLGKCVRELLEKGVAVPFEPLGVFDHNVAKVTRR